MDIVKFGGIVLKWSNDITKDSKQRKIRGITLYDMKLLKRMLDKNS